MSKFGRLRDPVRIAVKYLGWTPVVPPACQTARCVRQALFEHPVAGRRCASCLSEMIMPEIRRSKATK